MVFGMSRFSLLRKFRPNQHLINYSRRTILFHISAINFQCHNSLFENRRRQYSSTNFTKTIVEETIASVKNSPPELDSTDSVPHWVQSPIDYQIYRAKNVDELLNIAEKYRITSLQCVSFLARLCHFMPLDVEKLQQDARFNAVCKTLNDEIQFLAPGSVLLALRSLLYLRVSETSPLYPISKLRDSVKYLIRVRIPMPTLVPFACFHVDYVGKLESGRSLQTEMEDEIKLRLSEINDAKLILMMLSKIRREKYWMNPLELRALDMVDAMTSEQLALLLPYLAKAQSRNLQLLKAVGKKICDTNQVIPVKYLILLLTAANRLTYYEPSFMKRLCDDLEAQINLIDKHYFIEQLCTSIGVAKIRHEHILTSLAECTTKNFDFYKPSTLCSVVIMMARCNFTPPKIAGNDLLKKIRDYVTLDVVKQPALWLDYVWALSILQRLTEKEARSVLNKNFYTKVIQDKTEFRNIIVKLKLLNINTSARIELNEYDGPLLDESIYKSLPGPELHTISKYKSFALEMFLTAFTKVTKKYLICNRISPEGYVIDAEMRTDRYASPLEIEKWDDQSNEQIKVAFTIWNYFDKTLITDHLWGLNAMAVRHLELRGYIVVQINANDMAQHRTPLAKTEYLNKLFEDKMQNKLLLNSKK